MIYNKIYEFSNLYPIETGFDNIVMWIGVGKDYDKCVIGFSSLYQRL